MGSFNAGTAEPSAQWRCGPTPGCLRKFHLLRSSASSCRSSRLHREVDGYRLLASEFDSFPVNPEVNTIENCRHRVENDADIFVLLVGSRYGSIPEGEYRSVTNIEYLAARAIGLPIFAFINRDLLSLLPVWLANPSGDFSDVVDNPKLFDFVTQVRSEDRVWSFPFDTAQDIVSALRTQFAYQMSRGLAFLRRANTQPSELRDLHGDALRIAVEKPKGWQPRLLAELLDQQLYELRHLRSDHTSGFTPASGEGLSELEFGHWMQVRAQEARRLISQLADTLNETINTAVPVTILVRWSTGRNDRRRLIGRLLSGLAVSGRSTSLNYCDHQFRYSPTLWIRLFRNSMALRRALGSLSMDCVQRMR